MSDWLQRITDEVKPARGGSEILQDGLYKHTNISEYININLILSTPNINKVRYTKKNLLWQHLNYIDESLEPLRDTRFTKAINAFVYVSHWQYEKFRYVYQVPTETSYIIKNAIEPIEFIKKPKDGKIKLIYTSTPFRGLDVLLDAFEMLDRDDVELDVYSSTIVYGSGYQQHHAGLWDHMFERAKSMKNVNYIGHVENKDLHTILQSAHIFAYPSIFEETCCLSMVEAGAAGCKLVTTDLGALYETGSEYATMIPIQSSIELLAKNYAKVLNDEIDNYWSKSNQNLIKEQSDFYNKYYTWDKRKHEWNNLFERLSQ